MKAERLKEIEQYLIGNQTASLDTLCSLFNVSKNTIRRDVSELESRGVLMKVYGGVTLNLKEDTIPFSQRQLQLTSEKRIIGLLASELINSGDIIFIDSGSTTVHLIPHIKNKENITVISNSLNILVESAPFNNLNIISTGGILQRKTNSFTGDDVISFLNTLNINKAFMATTGVSIEKGVTNTSFVETTIKKAVIDISENIIVLADHSKLDTSALITYCNLDKIDYFVTNIKPAGRYTDFFNKNNVKLMYEK